jgi:hypothetical protein
MGTTVKLKRVDFTKVNFAPQTELVSMPRFWMSKGVRQVTTIEILESAAQNMYASSTESSQRIHSGRKFKVLQGLEEGMEYEAEVQIMVPNPAVTDDDLAEVEKKFGAKATKDFLAAIAAGANGGKVHEQLHFASVIE